MSESDKKKRAIAIAVIFYAFVAALTFKLNAWDAFSLVVGFPFVIGLCIWIAIMLSKLGFIWKAMSGETCALIKSNNRPSRMIIESEKYHRIGWKIVNVNNLTNFVRSIPFLGLRLIGFPGYHTLESITIACNDFREIRDTTDKITGYRLSGFPERVFDTPPIFHNHAYITPNVELSDNLGAKLYFLVRFRITNLYDAKYKTPNLIENLESVLLQKTKSVAADYEFDQLKSAQDFLEELKRGVNLELEEHYGIKVVGFHFIDLEPANETTRELLEKKGRAAIEAATLLISKKAEAEGERLVKSVQVKLNIAEFRSLNRIAKGNADMLEAYNLAKLGFLTAYSKTQGGQDGHRHVVEVNANPNTTQP